MSPRTPHEAQMAIEAMNQHIENLVAEIREAAKEAADAESAYELVFATARVRLRHEALESGIKATADMVDDGATIVAADEHHRSMLAKNNLSVCRTALDAAKSELDGLRSVSASYRAIT